MRSFGEELAAAARGLAQSPRYTALAVLCLGVGLGLAVAIFAVFRGVVLEPLPYPEPDRLRVVWNDLRTVGESEVPLSGHEYLDLATRQEALAPVGVAIGNFFNLTEPGEPERLWGVRASASFFDALGVEPAVGRGFAPDEDRFGVATVVLLSHGLWQRRFGGRREAVGEVLTLNGRPAEVIGVLPADFRFYDGRAELWVPVAMNLDALPPRGARGLLTVGRLAPGVSDEAAEAEIEALGRRFQEAHPEIYPPGDGYRLRLVSLAEEAVGPRVRTTLALLLAAAALVLAIAFANTVNLSLARSTVRAKDVALRLALGATRRRLVERFLAEGLLLALAAGAVGLFFAWGAVRLFLALAPRDLPRLDEVTLGPEVIVPTLALAIGLGVVLALVPLVSRAGSGGDRLAETLREGGKTAEASGAGGWLRDGLVVAEIAVATAVLVGAGLALSTWQELSAVEPGFAPDGALAAQISLPLGRYGDPSDQRAFFERLVDRATAIPGVARAGAGNLPPASPVDLRAEVELEGLASPDGEARRVSLRQITPGWLDALGVPVTAGRDLALGDEADTRPVALVDAELVRRWLDDRDPLGQRLRLSTEGPDAPWRTVVGVTGAVLQGSPGEEVSPHVYVPHAQAPFPSLFVVLRAEPGVDPAGLTGALRRAAAELDPDVPLAQVETLEARRGATVARERFQGSLLSVFALVALLLSGLGVYGVMSYTVARRQRELGVRSALGASPRSVLLLVVGRGLKLAAVGVALGLVLAVALGRLAQSLLPGIRGLGDLEPWLVVAVALILLALGGLASLGPALRAGRVDPLSVMR